MNLCKLKTILFDTDSGLYFGGHVAKLDASGVSTGKIVPLLARGNAQGRPDIVQVIDTVDITDDADPYYSIDILEANMAT